MLCMNKSDVYNTTVYTEHVMYTVLLGYSKRMLFCIQDLGRDIAADDTSTGGQMSPLTAAAAGALFGAGQSSLLLALS